MPELGLLELRRKLRTESHGLVDFVFDTLSPRLIERDLKVSSGSEKVVNDPIWKMSVVGPSVLPLMELPLLQRLRRVRQLGLAHLVYPGAHHSRFEHSLGSMRAAERMFDALAVSGNMPSEYQRRLRKVVTSAAILHDAGHTAFSHVGERVLQNALRDEYEAIIRILRRAFPDSLERVSTAPAIAPERHKLPAAAELMSALFVLSPSMEGIVPTLQHEFSPDECMMMMCGFILGRPWNLREGDVHYYWAKGIISGDLDCDKVDYVARDAYYAGIPTATDIDRLLSQLVAVKARDDISAPDLHYSFGRGNPTELQLFGIRPAGASALEMFVMTRSYLFERLYAHHKVRAAERLLQRLLLQRIQIGREDENWGLPEIFGLLYAPGGDDYVLGYLSNSSNEHFVQLARRILDRKLPARALAISASSMGTTPRAEATDVSTFLPGSWLKMSLAAVPST
jgi:hypothetical protein